MKWVVAVALTLALSGCGRVRYDALAEAPDGGGEATDAATDAGLAAPMDSGRTIEADGGVVVEADAGPPSSRCGELPEAIFCDGFESGDVAGFRSEVGRGTLEVVSDETFLGDRALRATASAGAYAYLARDIAPISAGEIFARMYVRVPSGTPIDPSDYVQLLRIGRESDPGHVHTLAQAGDIPVLWPEGAPFAATMAFARDRWLCVTVHLVMDAAAGSAELAIDGTPYVRAEGIPIVSRAMGFDEVSVGLVTTGLAQPEISVWFDEVALATTALPCD
jgi:hypothetical protein